MDTFLQQLINGVSLGAIYALIALGYTMVYGVLRLINFAHSEIFMIGIFASLFALHGLGMDPADLPRTGLALVGTLVAVGSGELTPADAASILARRDRRLAGVTAPPQGLTLVEVLYPARFDLPRQPDPA